MKKLQTERLILRAFKEDDVDDFHAYAKVEGVGENAGWKHHQSLDETKAVLKSFIDRKEVYAIVFKDEDKVIGSFGVHANNTVIERETITQKQIGYVLSKAYWHQGIMTEAATAVLQHCFEDLHVDQLNCGHFIENSASQKIIKKMGFIFIACNPYFSKSLNKHFEECQYVLTKADYLKRMNK